jgi:phosphinothricin acetyltransferase
MVDITIRLASAADLPAINDIYNHYVRHSTCSYQTDPETPESRRDWFAHHGARHPVTVAVRAAAVPGAGEVVGWGALSAFHPRAAYAHTVENSVYVRHDLLRCGVGKALLDDLIVRARQLGHHTVVALIDGEQAASVALHAQRGFVQVGYLKEAGRKFDRWLDVIYMQLLLNSGPDK